MTPEDRDAIAECVGRRGAYPPGALQWHTLRSVLPRLVIELDAVTAERNSLREKLARWPKRVSCADP